MGVVAPHFGALIGILLYDHIIGRNLKDESEEQVTQEAQPSVISHHDRASLVENMGE